MIVKDSKTVPLAGVTPAIHHAMNVVDRVWRTHTGQQARVTGLQEEGHSGGSRHYGLPGDVRCRAFDVDADDEHLTHATTRLNAAQVRTAILEELRRRLGQGEYDIMFELIGTPGAHLHIEEDPKP